MKFIFLTAFFMFFTIPVMGQDQFTIPFNRSMQVQQIDGAQQNTLSRINESDHFQPDIVGRKNVGLSFLMSLAIPGSGELYNGRKDQALIFLSSELLLWTGLFINNGYADHLKDEYYTYAAQHAGVETEGKNRQYWIDIGKYNSIYDFNEQRRRDRYFDAIYDENEFNYWLWDSENNRLRYDGKRITAGGIASQDVYFYAVILLNHVISGINSMRLSRQHNHRIMKESNWSIRFNSHSQFDSRVYGLNLTARF
jgi:hypothetical protein